MSESVGSSPSLKSTISEELQELREKGLAKSNRGKFKDSVKFRSPEEAQEYLKALQSMKKKNEKPKPPTNLKAGDLNDWYAQQRQRELIERKNREEAEKYLRGYRSKFSYDTIAPANSATPVTEGSVVAEEGAHVSDEVGKLQKGLDTFPSLSFDESEEANEDEGDGDKYAVPEGGVVEEGVAHVPEEVEKLEEKIDASPTLNSDDVEETITGDVVEADVEGDANDEDPATIVENEDVGTMEETTKGIDGQKDDEPEEFSLESSTLLEATAIVEDTETYESKTESVEEPLKEDAIADENSDQGSEPEENTESLPRSEVDDALSEEKEDVPVPVVQNDDSSVAKESLTVGEQVAESVTENDEEGADVEQKKEEGTDTANDDGWRFLISREPGSKFAPEPNRYHLYVAYACPWAHRTVIVRNLKGLQDVIGVTYVHPTWQFTNKTKDDHRGWVFGKKEGKSLSNTSGIGNFPSEWGEEDPLMGANSIRDIYLKVNDTTGKYILPVLWDKKYQTIVSNESSEIIRMLNSEFDEFATNDELDLYPSELQEEIDEVNKWVYPTFNNGVYRCGLSSTQEAYDDAIDELTSSFDKIDKILQKQRYLVGDSITEADIRLFVTLFRFDEVYDVYFKCNTRCVARTPALLNYVRDIYQIPGVTETCRMDMIKAHYYTSHVELNKYSIIPRGDNFQGMLDQPHGRDLM